MMSQKQELGFWVNDRGHSQQIETTWSAEHPYKVQQPLLPV